MTFPRKVVRKMVPLSLIVLGLVIGVSTVLSSGAEAQHNASNHQRWVHWSAHKIGMQETQQAIGRKGRNGLQVTDRMASVPQPLTRTLSPQGSDTFWIDTVSPDDSKTSENSREKTIASDEDLGDKDVPVLENREILEFAATTWANASFPVEQFQTYTSPFGYRSSGFHYGLDLAAPQQSYIRNWWAGTVIQVSDGGNCGTSIVVQSGEWTHMYCHMKGHVEVSGGVPSMIDRDGGIQVWEGQQIVAGARIGRVGMTGRTTGPHLHWELKYQGNWVNPAWVIQAMTASHQVLYGQN